MPHDRDNSHPNVAGSYLADPIGTHIADEVGLGRLSAELPAVLQSAAWQAAGEGR